MGRISFWLVFPVALLFAIGLLMVFNTTAAEIMDRSLAANTHTALIKQGIYGLIGFGCGAIVYWIGYRALLRHSPWILALVTVLLVLVFIPPFGQTINGARRWIGWAGFSLGQPSECAKLFIPLYFIHSIAPHVGGRIELHFFLKQLLLLAVPGTLILLEPDNGTTAILAVCMAVLFFLSRIRWVYWALPFVCLLGAGGIAASQMPHVPDRIRVYLHPELDLRGKGHQPHQAKIAAGSGRLWGRGFGQSMQKLNYLPEARSDYIAAIYAEEFGFMGILGLIALYLLFAYAGYRVAIRQIEWDAFLVSAFLTFLIEIQAFLNLGIVSGLLPSKGMTLPFFSQGGSSLVMNGIALGLLLDIARRSPVHWMEPMQNG